MKGVLFLSQNYIKGVPFLPKKGKGLELGAESTTPTGGGGAMVHVQLVRVFNKI